MRPYFLVESDHFKSLLRTLDPRYRCPSRTYFSETVIPMLYNEVKEAVTAQISKTDSWSPISPPLWSVWFLSSKAALKHERGARDRDGGGDEGKVSTRLTSATARYTGTKYRYNNAVQVRVPVRLSVPVHTSNHNGTNVSGPAKIVHATDTVRRHVCRQQFRSDKIMSRRPSHDTCDVCLHEISASEVPARLSVQNRF